MPKLIALGAACFVAAAAPGQAEAQSDCAGLAAAYWVASNGPDTREVKKELLLCLLYSAAQTSDDPKRAAFEYIVGPSGDYILKSDVNEDVAENTGSASGGGMALYSCPLTAGGPCGPVGGFGAPPAIGGLPQVCRTLAVALPEQMQLVPRELNAPEWLTDPGLTVDPGRTIPDQGDLILRDPVRDIRDGLDKLPALDILRP